MEFFRVETIADAEQLIRIIPEVIAMDTEYVKGDPRTTELLSVIIADEERAWVVNPSLLPKLTPTIKARKLIFLQDYNHCDTIILYQKGCDLRGTYTINLIDTHHIINETEPHDLGSRIFSTYGDNYKSDFWDNYENFEDAPAEAQLEYAGKDGIYTYRLGVQDLERVPKELYEHVRRTSLALLDTELRGVRVNLPLMQKTRDEMATKINGYLPKLREEFKHEVEYWETQKWEEERSKRSSPKGKEGVKRPNFSFASDRQIAWLVYEALGCKAVEKTKKGNPSTSFEAIKSLSSSAPQLNTLVEYKDTKTVFSTFVEGMIERVENGRIFPHFNVSGTDTGRLSHSAPNMANLPTTGVIRNFFVPDDGMVFVGADYAQLEVVVELNLTNDKKLMRIVNDGESKHDITANGLGISRDSAKTLNFALQYGAGVHKVSKILSISHNEASEVFRRYWELYSGVKNLKEETEKKVKETGKITNLFGRTRHFPKPRNEYEQAKQFRQAYNFLIQGVAGDACNRAYWQMHELLDKAGYGNTMFSVHDEVLCQVVPKQAEECKHILRLTMESVSEYLNFKYKLKAQTYGPLRYWKKA